MNTLLKIALSVSITGALAVSFASAPAFTFFTLCFLGLCFCCYEILDSGF